MKKKKLKKNSLIILECENCRIDFSFFNNVSQYTTTKNKQNILDKLKLKKYCKYCKLHTLFIEIK